MNQRLPQRYEPAVPVEDLHEHPDNARRGDTVAIGSSMEALGFYGAVIAQETTGEILVGNHRYRVAKARGEEHVPVLYVDVPDRETALRILVGDNRTSDLAANDDEALRRILEELAASDAGLAGTAFTDDDLAGLLGRESERRPAPSLADRFLFAPFSVLSARSGAWQDRKRRWLDLGIRSEIGRNDGLTIDSVSGRTPDYYDQKQRAEALLGRELTIPEFEERYLHRPEGTSLYVGGASVFDPVLCELAYRWFSPSGGTVLDPFAGGSVRGIVAATLGRRYVGVDLRADQVSANQEQGEEILPLLADPAPVPCWIEGDSTKALGPDLPYPPAGYDLLFSCPPYADLERYSDDPRDLSTMEYGPFLEAYQDIIDRAVGLLADDRFAVWVVGEVRGPGSAYRGFVPDTVRAFEDAGARYYNEAILVTPVGSLPVRAPRVFNASRALGRTHQTVLVFVKGDPKRATEACGPVEVGEIG